MPAKSVRKRSFTKDPKSSGSGALLGYARVSKGDEQNNALQTKALKAAGPIDTSYPLASTPLATLLKEVALRRDIRSFHFIQRPRALA